MAMGAIEAIFREALGTGAVKAVFCVAGRLCVGRCKTVRLGTIETVFGISASSRQRQNEGKKGVDFHKGYSSEGVTV